VSEWVSEQLSRREQASVSQFFTYSLPSRRLTLSGRARSGLGVGLREIGDRERDIANC
jgi:hypothetical protein